MPWSAYHHADAQPHARTGFAPGPDPDRDAGQCIVVRVRGADHYSASGHSRVVCGDGSPGAQPGRRDLRNLLRHDAPPVAQEHGDFPRRCRYRRLARRELSGHGRARGGPDHVLAVPQRLRLCRPGRLDGQSLSVAVAGAVRPPAAQAGERVGPVGVRPSAVVAAIARRDLAALRAGDGLAGLV